MTCVWCSVQCSCPGLWCTYWTQVKKIWICSSSWEYGINWLQRAMRNGQKYGHVDGPWLCRKMVFFFNSHDNLRSSGQVLMDVIQVWSQSYKWYNWWTTYFMSHRNGRWESSQSNWTTPVFTSAKFPASPILHQPRSSSSKSSVSNQIFAQDTPLTQNISICLPSRKWMHAQSWVVFFIMYYLNDNVKTRLLGRDAL